MRTTADSPTGSSWTTTFNDATDLTAWTPAVHGTDRVSITTTDNGTSDTITVILPTAPTDGQPTLFARLVVAP